ncbi:hypothetical protein M0Q97_07125 [Candidatus Dojkabacteria bacterium]|jgi:hypothetical protein|nr:hypothetical protein [Candidatus Dojkabacteria bacterium]
MLEKIIKKIVRKESLNEALEILSLSDDVSVDKFILNLNQKCQIHHKN